MMTEPNHDDMLIGELTKNKGATNYLKHQTKLTQQLTDYFEKEAILNTAQLTHAQLKQFGATIEAMCKSGSLERIGHDLLIDVAWSPDDFLIRQLILKQGIYFGPTALYLWGLSDQYPYKFYMSFKRGYKLPKSLTPWTQQIVVKQTNANQLNELVQEKEVAGTQYKIRLYSPERTLVDVLREPYASNIELVNTAYKRYLAQSKNNVSRLLLVAQKMNAIKRVSQRLEIML